MLVRVCLRLGLTVGFRSGLNPCHKGFGLGLWLHRGFGD